MQLDCHCHTVTLALERHAPRLWVSAITVQDNALLHQLAKANAEVPERFGLGLHPHCARDFSEEFLAGLEQMLDGGASKRYFVGEIGLEMRPEYLAATPLEVQIAAFKALLFLAFRRNLDVQVHIVSRGAPGCYGIVGDLLKEAALRWPEYGGEVLLHSFSGSFEQFLQLKRCYQNVVVGVSYLNEEKKAVRRIVELEQRCRLESDYDGSSEYRDAFDAFYLSRALQ